MANSKTWARMGLTGVKQAPLTLEIITSAGSTFFTLVEWSASWAINQVPESTCVLAVGRDARNVRQVAQANRSASSFGTMLKAKVHFQPDENSEFDLDGTLWPTDDNVIFDGYFVGFAYQKADDKVTVVAHLIHWLTDLGFTSTLSAISHPENPESMTFPCIVQHPQSGTATDAAGISDPGTHCSSFVGGQGLYQTLSSNNGDIWAGLKDFICGLSTGPGFVPIGAGGQALSAIGFDIQTLVVNNRAARALARIEGPAGSCTVATNDAGGAAPNNSYTYAKPLTLPVSQIGQNQVYQGIADVTSNQMAVNMIHMTAWDALVGLYCPMFAIDLCPQIDRAQIVARCPGFSGGTWKTITPDEYDYVEQSAMIPKPLRAVVVHGSSQTEDGFNSTQAATSDMSSAAGAFGSKAQENGDGAILYVQVPHWIGAIICSASNAGHTTGTQNNTPVPNAISPVVDAVAASLAAGINASAPDKPPSAMIQVADGLLNKYAQFVFVEQSLRGRSGTISGKLRFDIGPGSHLHIIRNSDLFTDDDELATDLYGQVNRVTCMIGAEGRQAATSFTLSHLRNTEENSDPRTSVASHPLFGDNVMFGSPLLPALNLPHSANTLIAATPTGTTTA